LGLLLGTGTHKEGEHKKPPYHGKDKEANLPLVRYTFALMLPEKQTVEETLYSVPPFRALDLFLQGGGNAPAEEKGLAVVVGGLLLQPCQKAQPLLGPRFRHVLVLFPEFRQKLVPVYAPVLVLIHGIKRIR
jgi:hypothetical protein